MPVAPLLIATPDRVFYRGPLGQPSLRRFAAAACYISLGGALTWVLSKVGEGDELSKGCGPALWVAPGVEHQIAAHQGAVLCYLIEPEFHDLAAWSANHAQRFMHASGYSVSTLALLGSWAPGGLGSGSAPPAGTPCAFDAELDAELDRLVLGAPLPVRDLDERIIQVLDVVRADAACGWQASDAARHCQLSSSRFMHLFKAEVGVGWRAFRAWKRARGLLTGAPTDESLTQLALTLGYPDASHFSHAIRQVTGLRPSDILSGGRRLGVWSASGLSRGVAS
jgi:AraC-like DNA-binding protein